VADYRDGIETRAVAPQLVPGELRATFPDRLPEGGASVPTVMNEFEELVMPGVVHWGHPAFLGYFGSTTTGAGIVAETLTAALNVSAMMWGVSPAATELEIVVLGWLRTLLELPAAFDGVVYDTASVATLHALAAAREVACCDARERGLRDGPPLAIYASDQAHSSVSKAAVVLGLGEAAVRCIESDGQFRLVVSALRQAIAADRARGVRPCAVVATVGTTETAAVDPVAEIARCCRSEGAWLHVDAAYGGAIGILPEGRWAMAGVDMADSVVVNPHKWLFVPLDFSVLFTRRLDVVRDVFALRPRYLEGDASLGEPNFMDYSLQLGRRFRALKAWMVWRVLGAEGLRARIREHLRLATVFAGWVAGDPAFELCAPVTMGVVCFRAVGDDDLNLRVASEVNGSGVAYLTHTRIRGRVALRVALGNILTEERHLARAWAVLRAAGTTPAREAV
jgi:aromatic-L-amino-acid decarboxylase